uniref:Uncharacterized protein n=1 Tax=Physcomitrium patens TaxID=3218 RepID=A0A2K1L2K3_PHYPA|nr:hypothetical protein PHYPA_003052 [Physcomitrium patens]
MHSHNHIKEFLIFFYLTKLNKVIFMEWVMQTRTPTSRKHLQLGEDALSPKEYPIVKSEASVDVEEEMPMGPQAREVKRGLCGQLQRGRGQNERLNERVRGRTNQRTNQRTNEPTNERTNQPTNERTNERTNQPTNERTNQRTNEPTNERTNQPTNERTNQPTNEPTNERTNQRTNEPTNERTNQPTNEPTSEPTNERTNQPINQRTDERTNQRTNEPKTLSCSLHWLGPHIILSPHAAFSCPPLASLWLWPRCCCCLSDVVSLPIFLPILLILFPSPSSSAHLCCSWVWSVTIDVFLDRRHAQLSEVWTRRKSYRAAGEGEQ